MASESLRDLVVSVALDTGDFNRNVKMLQAEMKEMDATFKNAGAGIKDYEESIEGLGKSADTIAQKLDKQGKVVEQLQGKLDKQGEALKRAAANYEEYLGKLQKMESGGAYDPGEHKKLVEQVDAERKALTTAETKYATYAAQLQNAQALQKELSAQFKDTQNEITAQNSGWDALQNKLNESAAVVEKLGDSSKDAESRFLLLAAESGQSMNEFASSADGMAAKIEMLDEKTRNSNATIAEYQNQLSLLGQQRSIAEGIGDTDKMADIDDQMRKVSVAMNEAQISAAKFGAESAKLTNELTALSIMKNAGWDGLQDAIDKSSDAVKELQENTKLAKADFELLASQNGGMEKFAASAEGTAAKVALLRTESENAQKSVAEYGRQIAMLERQKGIAESLGDEQELERIQNELNRVNLEMRNAQTEANNLAREADVLASAWTHVGETLEGVGERLTSFGQSMERAGQALTNTVTNRIKEMGSYIHDAATGMETAMSGVRKAFMGESESAFTAMEEYARNTSEYIGMAATDVADTISMVGQMGIPAEHFQEFTDTVLKLSLTTDMASTDIAKSLAQFANITNMPLENMENLGSAIEYMGVNMQTTETDIINMSTALAAAGSQVGMTNAEIVGMGSTLASLGIPAQKGGTAFSKALIMMQLAVETQSEDLKDFAKVAGMTAQEFSDAWNNKPIEAFGAFINGVARLDDEGVSSIKTLNDLGIAEVRLRDTLLRTTNANELFNKSIKMSNAAWEENTALQNAANTMLDTTAVKEENLKNKLKNFAQTLGDDLRPAYENIMTTISEYIDKLGDLDSEQRASIVKIGLLAAAAGPALTIFGKLTTGLGMIVGAVGGVAKALGSGSGLISALTATTGGTGLLVAGIAALAAGIGYAVYKIYEYKASLDAAKVAQKELNETAKEWENTNVTTGFESSKGSQAFHLSNQLDFNIEYDPSKAAEEGKKTGNAWLDGLIDVWTDGKKETDAIIQEWVDNAGVEKLQENISNSTKLTEEEREQAIKDLDEIDGQIESILKKNKNGLLSEEDINTLNQLYEQAHDIAIKFDIEFGENGSYGDLSGFYNDLQMGVQAALARGADPKDTFDAAFKSATDGLGQYTEQLQTEFDEKYKEIMSNTDLTSDEQKEQVKALKEWYVEAAKEAAQAYNDALKAAMKETGVNFDGGDENNPYADTIQQIERLQELIDAGLGDSDNMTEFKEILSGMDESQVVEVETALTAMDGAAETAGMTLAEVDANAAALSETLKTLKEFANGDNSGLFGGEGWEDVKKMFGEGNDQEVLEVIASLNVDGLETSYTAWANGEHAGIIATLDTSGITGLTLDTSSGITLATTGDGTVSFNGALSVNTKEGTVVALSPDGVDITPSTVTLTGLENAGIEGKGSDTGLGLTVASMDLQVENGKIVGFTGYSMDGEALTNITNADGSKFTIPDLELNASYKYSNVTGIPDAEITVPAKAVVGGIEVPEGVTLPEITITPRISFDNTGGKLGGTGLKGSEGFWGELFGPDSFNEAMQNFFKGLDGTDWTNFEMGWAADWNFAQIIRDGFTNVEGDTTDYGSIILEHLFSGVQADNLSAEDQAKLSGFFSDIMKFVDPEGIAFDSDSGIAIRQALMDSLFGEGMSATNSEDSAKLAQSMSEMFSGVLKEMEPPQTDDGFNLWDWIFGGSAKADEAGGDDSIAGVTDTIRTSAETARAELVADNPFDGMMDELLAGGSTGTEGGPAGGGMTDNQIAEIARQRIEAAKDSSELASAAQDLMSTVYSNIESGGSSYEGDFGITDTMNAAIGEASPDAEVDLSNVGVNGAENIGTNIAKGIAAGIKSGAETIKRAARDAAKAALAAAKSELGIRSPSRVFRDEIGVNAVLGMVQGFENESRKQTRAVANAMHYMVDGASGIVPGLAMAGGVYGGTTKTYNDSSSVNIYGNFEVRSDQDVRDLAREIATLTKSAQAGRGMR